MGEEMRDVPTQGTLCGADRGTLLQTAVFRQENMRLQEEVRMLRQHAHDTTHAHRTLGASVAAKDARAAQLQAACTRQERSAASAGARARALKRKYAKAKSRLRDMTGALHAMAHVRDDLHAAALENDTLRAAVESLRAELQYAQDQAARQLQDRHREVETLLSARALAREEALSRDELIAQVSREKAVAESTAADAVAQRERTERTLKAELELAKQREHDLGENLQHLHRYVGTRETEVLQLSRKLDDRTRKLRVMTPGMKTLRRENKRLQEERDHEELARLRLLARCNDGASRGNRRRGGADGAVADKRRGWR